MSCPGQCLVFIGKPTRSLRCRPFLRCILEMSTIFILGALYIFVLFSTDCDVIYNNCPSLTLSTFWLVFGWCITVYLPMSIGVKFGPAFRSFACSSYRGHHHILRSVLFMLCCPSPCCVVLSHSVLRQNSIQCSRILRYAADDMYELQSTLRFGTGAQYSKPRYYTTVRFDTVSYGVMPCVVFFGMI